VTRRVAERCFFVRPPYRSGSKPEEESTLTAVGFTKLTHHGVLGAFRRLGELC